MLEARRIALQVLVRVDQGGAFANRALDAALQSAGQLDPRDVALATELTYGTLRWQIFVDHALGHFSRTKLPDLDPETRALLRLGAFQLLRTRIPEHAAVHATVELAREVRNGRPIKYVNAVLRAIGRERKNILVPPAAIDPAGHLSLDQSIPKWIAQELVDERGFDAARAMLAALNQKAPFSLRVNLMRCARAEAERAVKGATGLDALPTRWSPAGLTVEGAHPTAALLRPEEGRWQAQDEAAQLVGYFLAPKPSALVLDACAAPGGKTCHLAEQMEDRGVVDAVDVHAGKLRDVEEGARRLGLTIVKAHPADATGPLPFGPGLGWEYVLVDAPCSGLGTIRRHPELKTRRTPDDVKRLAGLQSAILEAVAPRVRPGGVLVYAVCTFTREEGPRQVERFLARHPEFQRAPPPAGPVDFAPLLDKAGDLVLDPHRHGTDAFHAARLVRKGA